MTDDHYLWLDLETTGGIDSITGHSILELAFMVTKTNATLNPIDLMQAGIAIDIAEPTTFLIDSDLEAMDAEAYQMHHESGLISDFCGVGDLAADLHSIEDVEATMLDYLGPYFDGGLVLAGSGVSRFDRSFLKRDMPILESKLRYYEFDIASLRRGMQNAGLTRDIPTSSLLGRDTPPGKGHRADIDVLDHWHTARSILCGMASIKPEVVACISPHIGEVYA